jgi:glucose/arabinose dehydrogenase
MSIPNLRSLFALAAVAVSATAFADTTDADKGQRGEGVPNFTVRTGYKVTVALPSLVNARFMEFDSNGTLYVSQPDSGKITSFRAKPDGTLDKIADVVTGKRTVHGMCFYDGWLWFTTTGSINKGKIRADGSGLDDIATVIPDGQLPTGGAHWWRPILVDENGFYTGLGDPGNITDVDGDRIDPSVANGRPSTVPHVEEREKLWHFNLDGSGKTLFVSGIRNTEKLRFRPGTKEVWGCDHGSDNFGGPLGEVAGRNQPVTDMLPGDELNHYVEGHFYGHPYVVGNNIPRIEYQKRPDILDLEKKTTAPAFLFGPHWANNGWCFLTKDTFPNQKGDLFVAFHGSWNSTKLVGYRIERVIFDQLSGQPVGSMRIVSTIDPSGRPSLASPVDCCEAPDGTILFSVDTGVNRGARTTGAIYRISPADK